ncbi:hypothetical protein D9757_002856 [Collybiopsis confluens]|uniref:Phosphatidylglycerol/phosphatidylinositol transfer protein n=1 Tax=Collybiopsis confluens TaxID=2823264 RepID=A0A8H5ME32_9AGAR|nr:hypothetical protein D9757_002856 [Collybiopsis confluens]
MRHSALVAVFGFLSLVNAASLFQTPLNVLNEESSLSDKWKWSDCGLETDPLRIRDIQISPDPPAPGKPLTVNVTATANERIEEGAYVDVTVKLGLIKLLTKQFDVCEEARNANASVQCPVDQGAYNVAQTVDLPREIPPGSIYPLSRFNDANAVAQPSLK